MTDKPLTRADLERFAAKLAQNGLAPGQAVYAPRQDAECSSGRCEACSKLYGLRVEHIGLDGWT